jgi:hypothetical protein
MHVHVMRITMRFTWALQHNTYIDHNPTTSMTNNPPIGYHPNNRWVLSCKQQIIALRKACNIKKIQMSLNTRLLFSP